MKKFISNFKFHQAFFAALLLTTTLLLINMQSYSILSNSVQFNQILHFLFTTNPTLSLSCIWRLFISIFLYYISRPKFIFLLDFSCFKPNPNQKCGYATAESFVRRTNRYTKESGEFMLKICLNSGIGDETYAPQYIFDSNPKANLKYALDEAQQRMFASINSLLAKTKIDPSRIDCLIVTCGSFSPMLSLTSLIVNHFKLKPSVKTYNLSGMGCSSGVISIDLAVNVLKQSKKIGYALVVATEKIIDVEREINYRFLLNRILPCSCVCWFVLYFRAQVRLGMCLIRAKLEPT